MKENEVMPRYGKHYNAIKTIGKYPLAEELQLSDVGNKDEMKKVVQACYYEMKKDDLDVSVIDYLCQISTLYLMSQTDGDYKKILLRYDREKEEVKNFLRYFMKDPFFFSDYDEVKFKEITVFWYKILNEERTNTDK